MKEIFVNAFHKLFPGSCILCKAKVKNDFDLCDLCAANLPYINNICKSCGMLLDDAPVDVFSCGNCMDKHLPFDQVLIPFHYREPISNILSNLKFNHQLGKAKILSKLMCDFLCENYHHKILPDLIIPIPLSMKRLRERGFNQALELASPIAKKLKIPLDKFNCQRKKHTLPQTSLNIRERQKNLREAFSCDDNYNLKHVAILDDVFTTGSTVYTFSKMLKKFGVKKIDVWCFARVYLRSRKLKI